jgi:hypothetical protein
MFILKNGLPSILFPVVAFVDIISLIALVIGMIQVNKNITGKINDSIDQIKKTDRVIEDCVRNIAFLKQKVHDQIEILYKSKRTVIETQFRVALDELNKNSNVSSSKTKLTELGIKIKELQDKIISLTSQISSKISCKPKTDFKYHPVYY